MAVFKTTFEGVDYEWIEKDGRACLKSGSRGIWWGDPNDPKKRRELMKLPVQLLLDLTILRNDVLT